MSAEEQSNVAYKAFAQTADQAREAVAVFIDSAGEANGIEFALQPHALVTEQYLYSLGIGDDSPEGAVEEAFTTITNENFLGILDLAQKYELPKAELHPTSERDYDDWLVDFERIRHAHPNQSLVKIIVAASVDIHRKNIFSVLSYADGAGHITLNKDPLVEAWDACNTQLIKLTETFDKYFTGQITKHELAFYKDQYKASMRLRVQEFLGEQDIHDHTIVYMTMKPLLDRHKTLMVQTAEKFGIRMNFTPLEHQSDSEARAKKIVDQKDDDDIIEETYLWLEKLLDEDTQLLLTMYEYNDLKNKISRGAKNTLSFVADALKKAVQKASEQRGQK